MHAAAILALALLQAFAVDADCTTQLKGRDNGTPVHYNVVTVEAPAGDVLYQNQCPPAKLIGLKVTACGDSSTPTIDIHNDLMNVHITTESHTRVEGTGYCG